ncbi:hypothetical protein F4781DRAFT_433017 [Annulohypoxylon bovei var. microspora]|nr:hypothetical protein F4781DRAFT_433017 [Annulohypoxylon bovei var. microspora]
MDIILDTRAIKSSGRKGSSYKSSSNHYYGGGGGGGAALPVWVYVVIVLGVIWVCIYLALFFYFFRKEYLLADPLKRRRLGPALIGRLAWKAFRYATPLQPIIWCSRKLWARCRRTKKVGGTFYRKIEEEERGTREPDASEPVGVVPPAQLRGEPLMSPVVTSKGPIDR